MKYKDAMLPISERVEDLLSRMTLEEKIAQTLAIGPNELVPGEEERKEVLKSGNLINIKLMEMMKYGIGSFQLPGKNLLPEDSGSYRNALQKYLMENTRLQIPALSQEECLNGQLAKGATMFPRPIGMAGSFDTELVEEVYSAVGKEVRARGGHQAFTPVLDVGRDPRWGRIEETFGEDTYLVSEMGKAVVKGLQGGASGVAEDHIISSPKHFAGYAQVAGGRNFAPTMIPRRELEDEILPPFEAAVKDAHALGMMASHAEIDGIPCHGNRWLLTEVLRERWGFEGIVVSDYADIQRLEILHHVAKDITEAAAMGLKAGVDMDLPQGISYRHLGEAIKRDPKVAEYLDTAVRRILTLKFQLGLFEHPYVDTKKIPQIVGCEDHVALAKKAAEKTVILLKNEGKLLPLNQSKLKTIAVIGPTADPVEFSYYSERPNIGVSILDGIIKKTKGSCEVLYEMGCHITKQVKTMETEMDAEAKNPVEYTYEEEKYMIENAVKIAKKADIAIVCLGGSPSSSREAVTLQKHYGDNASLDLTGQQNELLKQVLQTGTPVVTILINGKPMSCGYVYDHSPAVLEGWYLGQQTGTAMAELLFGDKNPGAKLPVTIVRNAGHLPGYYSQKPTAFLKGYLFEKNEPYFCFGYGLSYTEFTYGNVTLSAPVMKKDETITASVTITNIGDYDGDEIVQMYISDPQASITRPERELKGFKRVSLQKGETKTVTFEITEQMLAFTGIDYKKKAEAGEFIVRIGKNCRETQEVSFVYE